MSDGSEARTIRNEVFDIVFIANPNEHIKDFELNVFKLLQFFRGDFHDLPLNVDVQLEDYELVYVEERFYEVHLEELLHDPKLGEGALVVQGIAELHVGGTSPG